ncbi:MAG: hypothetical protein ACI93R_002605 [Flavobacteriales bacterium]
MQEKILVAKSELIHRPDKPHHFMVLEKAEHAYSAYCGDNILAMSSNAMVLKEQNSKSYEPKIYFPLQSVFRERLVVSDKQTHCPLKGQARYYHLKTDTRTWNDIAWQYCHVENFDPRLWQLLNYISFDTTQVSLSLNFTDV